MWLYVSGHSDAALQRIDQFAQNDFLHTSKESPLPTGPSRGRGNTLEKAAAHSAILADLIALVSAPAAMKQGREQTALLFEI